MSDEAHRHACEVRYWLERTGGDHGKLREVLRRVAEKRGEAGAEKLRRGIWAELRRAGNGDTNT